MDNLEYQIIKIRDKLWNNYMIHTPYEFQKKWSNIESWRDPMSYKLIVTIFLDELLIELYKISKKLVISLEKMAKKNNIQYLVNLCKNFSANNCFLRKNSHDNGVNFITSSCFSPPETDMYISWKKLVHISNLDEVFKEKKVINNFFSYTRENTKNGIIHTINLNNNKNSKNREETSNNIGNMNTILTKNELPFLIDDVVDDEYENNNLEELQNPYGYNNKLEDFENPFDFECLFDFDDETKIANQKIINSPV